MRCMQVCTHGTCDNSYAIFFSVTPDPYKLLAQVMSYVGIIVYKQAHWLVQRKTDKFFNLKIQQRKL